MRRIISNKGHEVEIHRAGILVLILGGEELKAVLFIKADCPGIIVSIDGDKAATGLISESEEGLNEIHHLGPYALIVKIHINTETADFYSRVAPEMFLVRDILPDFSKHLLFAVLTAYTVIENTKEGNGLFFILEYVGYSKELPQVVKGILLEKFVEVRISAVKRLYL